jgi:hypothetical protein
LKHRFDLMDIRVSLDPRRDTSAIC